MIGGKNPAPTGPGTVVGANVKLVGTLHDQSDIIIHGRVEGEVISSSSVSIMETAYIKGPISAEIVSISGKVKGSITSSNKLEINPTGKVFGSVACKELSIKPGAIFVGKCTMPEGEREATTEEEPEEETPPPAPATAPENTEMQKETAYEV